MRPTRSADAPKSAAKAGHQRAAAGATVQATRSTTPRRRSAGLEKLAFVEGDALELPFAAERFHIVTIGYGLRNLADMDRGLAELLRVVKPGGIVLVLDFGKPDNALWRALYFAYLRWIVPVMGWLFCGDAATHGYILESLKHYPGQRGVEQRMRATGFVETRIINLLGGMMSINIGRRPDETAAAANPA